MRSNAEMRFFRLWEETGLPVPEVNAVVAGLEVDFFWRDIRLVIEIDGASFHDRRGQGERDRRRDVALSLADCSVHRFGADRVYREPRQLIDEVKRLWSLRVRQLAAVADIGSG